MMHRRILSCCAALLLGNLLLACGGAASAVAAFPPRWACPSPTPKPYGPDAPPKREWQETTTNPQGTPEQVYRREDWAEWEQEYGQNDSSPPFPSPTPYGMLGTQYVLGQRVEIWPFHAQVLAEAGRLLANGSQLYLITIRWVNHTTTELPFDYPAQVVLHSITDSTGHVHSSDEWRTSSQAAEAAQISLPPTTIPAGESEIHLPILAPPGNPETIDLLFRTEPNTQPAPPFSTPVANTPTTLPATPTPRGDISLDSDPPLVVQWSNAPVAANLPTCDDPGALTDWGSSANTAWGRPQPVAVAAPSGASRVVQLALAQVGKPYVWGAEGPDDFDCSGLTQWSYEQVGIDIPRTAHDQWLALRHIPLDQLRPGYLMYFAERGSIRISHTAMLVGDLNGDGRWDIVHAMSPDHGIRVTYGVLESTYYGNPDTCELCVVGVATRP